MKSFIFQAFEEKSLLLCAKIKCLISSMSLQSFVGNMLF